MLPTVHLQHVDDVTFSIYRCRHTVLYRDKLPDSASITLSSYRVQSRTEMLSLEERTVNVRVSEVRQAPTSSRASARKTWRRSLLHGDAGYFASTVDDL